VAPLSLEVFTSQRVPQIKLGLGGPLSLGKVGLEKKRKSLKAIKRMKRGMRVLDGVSLGIAEIMPWRERERESEAITNISSRIALASRLERVNEGVREGALPGG